MNRSSLLVLFCLVFLYSCETLFEADLSPTNNSITTLNIRLTDGPIDLEEVNIDLQGVVVKGEEGFEEIALETNTGIYDLLDFQNGIDTLIAMADIQLGRIREVRLILGDNNTVVVDGETHELKIPSGSQSGLKIKACLDLGPMTEFDLLLDFDAGASIHQTGNGKYIMRPVIKIMNAAAQCEEEQEEEEENENPIDSLPQGILEYIDANYPDLTFSSSQQTFCDDTEVYILEGKNGPVRVLLYFDLDGNFVQSATSFDERNLNDDVLASIDTDYSEYRVMNNKAWKIERADGDLWYRIYIKENNSSKKIYVIYAADGTFICEEE